MNADARRGTVSISACICLHLRLLLLAPEDGNVSRIDDGAEAGGERLALGLADGEHTLAAVLAELPQVIAGGLHRTVPVQRHFAAEPVIEKLAVEFEIVSGIL